MICAIIFFMAIYKWVKGYVLPGYMQLNVNNEKRHDSLTISTCFFFIWHEKCPIRLWIWSITYDADNVTLYDSNGWSVAAKYNKIKSQQQLAHWSEWPIAAKIKKDSDNQISVHRNNGDSIWKLNMTKMVGFDSMNPQHSRCSFFFVPFWLDYSPSVLQPALDVSYLIEKRC